jgi:antitoxin component HigA of HigAB toxin-antitoxin module
VLIGRPDVASSAGLWKSSWNPTPSALALVEELMGREIAAGSEEFVQLDQLSQLVEKYEKVEFPIEPPFPPPISL